MGDYNLLLYTPIITGKSFVDNITPIAEGWERSVKLQGGFWTGHFIVSGAIDLVRNWFYNYLNYHVEERSPTITWEGYIDRMEIDDERYPAILDVYVNGYIFKAADYYVPRDIQWPGDTTVSAWFSSLAGVLDSTIFSTGVVDYNSTGIKSLSEATATVGDDMQRLIDIGDTDLQWYRYYCTTGGKLCYEKIDLEPQYYLYSGMRRTRGIADMANYIHGEYTNPAGKRFLIIPQSEPGSIEQYGHKELKLTDSEITPETSLQIVRLNLAEKAWPWAKPESITNTNNIVNKAGENITAIKWRLQPGVIRDMGGTVSTGNIRSAADPHLTDRRDILAGSVFVSQDKLIFEALDLENANMINALRDWRRRTYYRPPVRRYGGPIWNKSTMHTRPELMSSIDFKNWLPPNWTRNW